MDKYQFTEKEINRIWDQAIFISHVNEKKGFRQDEQGCWIRRSEYGNSQSEYGWLPIKVRKTNGKLEASDFIPCHWSKVAEQQPFLHHQSKLKIVPFDSVSPTKLEQLWACTKPHSSENEAKGFRLDTFGNWIGRSLYGAADSPFGWCVVLVEGDCDAHEQEEAKIFPANLQYIRQLLASGKTVSTSKGWTTEDSVELAVQGLDIGINVAGSIVASAIMLPFSFLQ